MAQSLLYLANGEYLHAFLEFVGTVIEIAIGFYVLQALQKQKQDTKIWRKPQRRCRFMR